MLHGCEKPLSGGELMLCFPACGAQGICIGCPTFVYVPAPALTSTSPAAIFSHVVLAPQRIDHHSLWFQNASIGRTYLMASVSNASSGQLEELPA